MPGPAACGPPPLTPARPGSSELQQRPSCCISTTAAATRLSGATPCGLPARQAQACHAWALTRPEAPGLKPSRLAAAAAGAHAGSPAARRLRTLWPLTADGRRRGRPHADHIMIVPGSSTVSLISLCGSTIVPFKNTSSCAPARQSQGCSWGRALFTSLAATSPADTQVACSICSMVQGM